MTNSLMDILTELKDWLEDKESTYMAGTNFNPYETVLNKIAELERDNA